MPRLPLHSLTIRLYRAGVVLLIAWLMHQQYAWWTAQRGQGLAVASVQDFFPEAASLGSRDPDSGIQKVLDEQGLTLGLVTQTAPLSDKIIGYSGPTNTLIVMDAQMRVTGLRVLHSGDTPDHLSTVLRKRSFFDTFKGLKLGGVTAPPKVDAVSGATLTSTAIAQGVLNRLGQQGPSLRFPQEITLEEVQALQPEASTLHPVANRSGVWQVLDTKGDTLALALRTAPLSDGIVGYKGPTDTLILLDSTGQKVKAFRLRKSFDTQEYVGYVTGNDYFLHSFDGMEVDRLANLDFQEAKVEGVSGATDTSWAVAEGLKRRSAALVSESTAPVTWVETIHFTAADAGLLVVVIFSVVMTFTSLRGRRWARWLHQALIIGYAGVYCGLMISQGLLIGWARHGVPWQSAPLLALIAALALLLPWLSRRQFYCHHYCPHGALQQWLSHRLKRHWRVPPVLGRWLERLPAALLALIIVGVMALLPLNLNAMEPFDAWLVQVAGWGTLLVASVGLLFSFFTPMAYCRYGCPTGALLKFMRYAGQADHFGLRDGVALLLVGIAVMLHWQREVLIAW